MSNVNMAAERKIHLAFGMATVRILQVVRGNFTFNVDGNILVEICTDTYH